MSWYNCVGIALMLMLICYNYVPDNIRLKVEIIVKQTKEAIAKSKQVAEDLEETIQQAQEHADKIKDELQDFVDKNANKNK